MINDNRDNRSNSDVSAGANNQILTPDLNKESRFKQSAMNQSLKKKLINRMVDGKIQQSVKDNSLSSQLITSQNNQMRSQIHKKNIEDESKNIATTELNQNENNEVKRKGIFEEYQERWNKNNKKIFRYLITWRVGDDGKIEDQLKLMITYLSIIFIFILVICGFATTYYFHQTNKENIRYSIENQAKTILENGLSQYQNSTEYIFKGYEFVLNYLNDIILSKLEISYKIYNFNEIRQFPYKGPNRMHHKGDPDKSKCDIYKGKVQFDKDEVSMKCIDWYEFDSTTKPTVHKDVYQQDISTDKLNQAIDILNYILESQLFDVFVTKIYKIYFGFETRQHLFMFPGLILTSTPNTYRMNERSWYNNTKWQKFLSSNKIQREIPQKMNSSLQKSSQGKSQIYFPDIISKLDYLQLPQLNFQLDLNKNILASDAIIPQNNQFLNHLFIDFRYHLNQQDNSTFRVISTPYYDAGSKTRVVTISKAITAPSPEDTTKRYLKGKGLFMGVASVDIKLKEFQELFQDITFYETGYLAIVSNQGKLLNEPAEFIRQINMEGKDFEDLSITQLIENDLWEQIKESKQQLLQQTTSKQDLEIVIASSVNRDNFYEGESVVIMFIIPSVEVYGAIDKQNSENLKRILLSSLISFGGFLLATIICTIYVKKKIIQMVSAITELNQSALKLSGQNNDSSTHSKKEVMQKLNEIQQKAESETIKELVKGFENQLKGISKLGKGGQNILKNGKNVLKYDSAEYCGTNLAYYIDPLLSYLDSKKEKMDTDSVNYKPSHPLYVNQIPVKTLSSHLKQSPLKKKEVAPLTIISDNPNDTHGELLNMQSQLNQTITSPLSDISGNKTTLFKSNLNNSKANPNRQSIKLCQNEKIAGESNQAGDLQNCSETEIDDNDDVDDIHYQF